MTLAEGAYPETSGTEEQNRDRPVEHDDRARKLPRLLGDEEEHQKERGAEADGLEKMDEVRDARMPQPALIEAVERKSGEAENHQEGQSRPEERQVVIGDRQIETEDEGKQIAEGNDAKVERQDQPPAMADQGVRQPRGRSHRLHDPVRYDMALHRGGLLTLPSALQEQSARFDSQTAIARNNFGPTEALPPCGTAKSGNCCEQFR